MNAAVTFTLLWLAISLILVAVIFLARSIVNRTAEGEPHLSAQAGFLAGLVASVAVIALHVDRAKDLQLDQISVSLGYSILAVSAIGGYFLVVILKRLIPTNFVGLVVLFLTFAGTTSLYGYTFIESTRNAVLSGGLGLAFGVLLHAIMSPRSIAEFFPGDHSWLENLRDFEREETVRQVEFKRNHWPDMPDGRWSNGPAYLFPHVLPEGHLGKAFYPPIVNELAQYCRDRHIPIQMDGLNLLSARSACLNLFFPLRLDLEVAARVLGPLLPEVKRVNRIELAYGGDEGAAIWLGEPTNGSSGKMRTMADVAVWWEDGNQRMLTLIAWNYAESGLGACEGFESRGNQRKHLCLSLRVASPDAAEECYLAKGNGSPRYWHRLAEAGIDFAALSHIRGCPFRGPLYPLLRQQLLAAYLRKSAEVDRVDTVLLGFRGNKNIYRVPEYLLPLGHNIPAVWNNGLDGVPQLRYINVEEIAAALRGEDSETARPLASYLNERYGL